MGDEYKHFINDYLVPNPTVYHYGYSALSEAELGEMLHALKPCERPDMYAKLGNTVYILEHFEFDYSKESRKGMRGIAAERALDKKIEDACCDNEFHYEKVNYGGSFSNYQKNFEAHFRSHYNKIHDYKEHFNELGILLPNDSVKTGFWVENLYPPLYENDGLFEGELPYAFTKQFAESLRAAPLVDFILFGGCLDGKLQLVYLDKNSLPPEEQQIDLTDPRITWSRMNGNEVTVYIKGESST